MPLNLQALPLDPQPESVHQARAWVRNVLSRLQRDDIVEAAELGVSELVTNAILHGAPPITVRVRGTRDHPRVEIRDASARPPEVNIAMADEAALLTTVGRGLALVALNSSAWGAELVGDGKVVWFEPVGDPREDGDLSGQVSDFERSVRERLDSATARTERVPVRILDLPVALYHRFRQRYYELGRELRLLSLAHGQAYPVATDLTEVFLEVEQDLRMTEGMEELERLLESDQLRGDLELLTPVGTAAVMARLLDTLERADRFCREQRLLVLSATAQDLELQRWYLGEFVRQGRGEQPLPWPGSFAVDDERPNAS